MDVYDTPTPELQTMTLGLYDLVQLALLGAGFALLEPVWTSHVHKSDGVQPEVRRIARA